MQIHTPGRVLSSGDHGGRVVVVDHVGGRGGGLAPPRRRLGAAAHAVLGSLDLQPRVPQGFGKVIIHRARDGHRVRHRLGLLVVLAQAPAEVLLHHRVTRSGGCGDRQGQSGP